jgi:superfamily II DNA or RNA helicase
MKIEVISHTITGSAGNPGEVNAAGAGTHGSARAVLRPHQIHLIEQIEAAIAVGECRTVAQAPTGFGKTIVAAAITRKAIEQNKRIIFTMPAISLVDQTVEKF